MTRHQVLRSLSRFDEATSFDVGNSLGITSAKAGSHLRALVGDGLAEEIKRKHAMVRFRVTEAGRVAVKGAA